MAMEKNNPHKDDYYPTPINREKLQAVLSDISAQIAEIDCGLPNNWFKEIMEAIREI